MLRSACVIFFLIFGAFISYFGTLTPLELKVLDTQFKLLRLYSQEPVQNDVVVVGLSEATTEILREPITLWHAHLGKFLEAASSGGASVIGLDVILPDRSFDAILPGNDRRLLVGLLTARRKTAIVLARTVEPSGVTRKIYPAFVTAAGNDALGYALLPIDYDGAVRRFDERIAVGGSAVTTLVGQMARKLGKSVEAGLLDYAVGNAFGFIPLETVIAWADTGNATALYRTFHGKAVLLGSVLKYEDRYPAPVNLAAWDSSATNVPGVLLHAQALRNLMNGGLVRPVTKWIPLLLSLSAGLLWLWGPRPIVAIPAVVALVFGLAIASTTALKMGFYLPMVHVMVVVAVAIASRQILEVSLSLRERRRLRRAFGGYVSPPVLEDILSGKLTPDLGGEKKFACVLFSDIRGYTSRSEHASPEETIAFLNRYFERVVPIIHAHAGTVVSFMGDGIMAVFGAPNFLPNPCMAAYSAAREMLSDCQDLNVELENSNEEPLQIGIGLHAGEGLAGHIGAASRHEYSVIGDVTNVASRLEGLTKDVGYRLVISRTVAHLLDSSDGLVALGWHQIKGHSPVDIFGFDLIVPTSELPTENMKLI